MTMIMMIHHHHHEHDDGRRRLGPWQRLTPVLALWQLDPVASAQGTPEATPRAPRVPALGFDGRSPGSSPTAAGEGLGSARVSGQREGGEGDGHDAMRRRRIGIRMIGHQHSES
jgi:hypothetical protein